MSSWDGSGLPAGWLWASIILAHVSTMAPRYTSLGATTEELRVPSDTISNPVTTFSLFNQKQQSAHVLHHRKESGRFRIHLAVM